MAEELVIYVVRHGQTYLNQYDRMQGWSDTPLTEQGIAGVKRFADKIQDVDFLETYSSDLRRTVETSQYIIEKNNSLKGKHPVQLPQFREAFFGSLEGEINQVVFELAFSHLGVEKIEDLWESDKPIKMNDVFKAIDPAGDAEGNDEIIERLKAGLEIITARHKGQSGNVLLVTHGNVIRNLIFEISGEMLREIENASVTQLIWDGQEFSLGIVNQA